MFRVEERRSVEVQEERERERAVGEYRAIVYIVGGGCAQPQTLSR